MQPLLPRIPRSCDGYVLFPVRNFGLSRGLLAEGYSFCSLFADLANNTANSMYLRIGYKPVCDYDQYVAPWKECRD